MTARAARETAAIAAIGLALCLMMYHQVRWLAPLQPHSAYTFAQLARQPRSPREPSDAGKLDLQKRWAPRILSNTLAVLITQDCLQGSALDVERFSHRVGLYASVWLGMIFCLYLLILRELSLIPILGTFCGVAFGYMPGIADRIYPWDMSALFFYSLFIGFLIAGRIKWFLVVLPVAVLFKETACVLALAYLFLDEPLEEAASLVCGCRDSVWRNQDRSRPCHAVGWWIHAGSRSLGDECAVHPVR